MSVSARRRTPRAADAWLTSAGSWTRFCQGTEYLSVSIIDPGVETERYQQKVLAERGGDLDEAGKKLLKEDLRAPCTEEIAVFGAFARLVAKGDDGFVVLDTDPTGHTLLLLDATEAYHREVTRSKGALPDTITTLLWLCQRVGRS